VASFVLRRLLALIPVLLLITFLVFGLELLLGADPARTIAGGLKAPVEKVEEVRHRLGLDDPIVVQYGRWAKGAVQGDLGTSLISGRSVAGDIGARFPVTLSVALGATVLSVLIGVPLGLLAGTRAGSGTDRTVTVATSTALAIPDFWLASILVVLLAVSRRWLPSIGYVALTDSPVEWARHLVMPWIALGLAAAATMARQVRGAVIDVLAQDYVRTARAKGLPARSVIGKHVLKNAATPALTILGLQFAYSLGGTLIIEQIYSLPGLGTYMVEALTGHDLPVIQGVVLVVAVIFVMVNLAVDVAYGLVNPKVRLG
jgi:peptide/nickel transport system permease protein